MLAPYGGRTRNLRIKGPHTLPIELTGLLLQCVRSLSLFLLTVGGNGDSRSSRGGMFVAMVFRPVLPSFGHPHVSTAKSPAIVPTKTDWRCVLYPPL